MSIAKARTSQRKEQTWDATPSLQKLQIHQPADERGTAASPQQSLTQTEDLPTICAGGNRSGIYLFVRRSIDIIGGLTALALFAPIMLFSTLVLLVTTRGRPIFRQQRIGFRGKPFTMYKFRTMSLNAESLRHLVTNERQGPVFKNRTDPRITRFGRFLRSFSIDEMPQLFNVLRGDMSLVGPRPPIHEEVLQYTADQFKRLSVKPGLTCFWQVSGRAELDFEQQVALDVSYVQNQSLLCDVWLLLRTPLSVLTRRGAY